MFTVILSILVVLAIAASLDRTPAEPKNAYLHRLYDTWSPEKQQAFDKEWPRWRDDVV